MWKSLIMARIAAATAVALTAGFGTSKQQVDCGWVGSWAASQQLVESWNELPVDPVANITIRQTVRPTLGGDRVRLRFSNEFGEGPLVIGAVNIAEATAAGSPAIDEHTVLPLTFAGRPSVTVPPGAVYYTDSVAYSIVAFKDVSVTLFVKSAPDRQTGHPGSRTTSHFLAGDLSEAATLQGASTLDHWYYLSGIEVQPGAPAGSIGVIGDSITDGRGSTTNHNNRWTDLLAGRLQSNENTRGYSVLNLGLGGNRVLNDGLGPSVLARIDRDVLTQPNLRYLIVFEGINDIGTLAGSGSISQGDQDHLLERLRGAYRQVVVRAHSHGIRAYGATITPFKGSEAYPFEPMSEQTRQKINDWIRSSGTFDAVLDFDVVLRDPGDPQRLNPAYDTGDNLHPSPAGFQALAESVPLELFTKPPPISCD